MLDYLILKFVSLSDWKFDLFLYWLDLKYLRLKKYVLPLFNKQLKSNNQFINTLYIDYMDINKNTIYIGEPIRQLQHEPTRRLRSLHKESITAILSSVFLIIWNLCVHIQPQLLYYIIFVTEILMYQAMDTTGFTEK